MRRLWTFTLDYANAMLPALVFVGIAVSSLWYNRLI